jgi:hypothetical protein
LQQAIQGPQALPFENCREQNFTQLTHGLGCNLGEQLDFND